MADRYRFIKDTYDAVESYAVYSASGISQGDMMQWDTGSRLAVNNLLVSGSIFLGVAEERNPVASLGTSDRPLTGGRIRIKGAGIHAFKTTTSEVYSHLDAVYQGADAQTVSKVGSTRIIGRVHLPDGTTVTGASGTDVNVRIFGNLGCNSVAPSSADAAR